MNDIYAKLKEQNIELPPAPPKGGIYTPAKEFGDKLVYISGCGPNISETFAGRIGREYSKDEGVMFSRNCMLNILSVLEDQIGDLNRVKSVVKILTFVSSDNDFYEQPYVANGGSQLLKDLFGEAPSRSAIGVNVLPGNIPVETEAIFELKD